MPGKYGHPPNSSEGIARALTLAGIRAVEYGGPGFDAEFDRTVVAFIVPSDLGDDSGTTPSAWVHIVITQNYPDPDPETGEGSAYAGYICDALNSSSVANYAGGISCIFRNSHADDPDGHYGGTLWNSIATLSVYDGWPVPAGS